MSQAPRPGPGMPPQGQPFGPGPGQPPRPPGTPPPGPPRRGGSGRRAIGRLLVVVGAFVLLAGSAITAGALILSQRTVDNDSGYGPVMWRNARADRFFPATIATKEDSTTDQADPKRAMWRRLGISPDNTCDKGLTAATLKSDPAQGCKAVLRATYADPSGGNVATVAVIVLPPSGDTTALQERMERLPYDDASDMGVHAYRVPETVASHWTDAARNATSAQPAFNPDLPYVVAVTAGAADGRKAGRLPAPWSRVHGAVEDDKLAWIKPARDLAKAFGEYLDVLMTGDS